MRQILWIIGLLTVTVIPFGHRPLSAKQALDIRQDTVTKPYHPLADAQADLDSLIRRTQKDGKHIIIQAGGNWCVWCLRFHAFIQQSDRIQQVLGANYYYYHLNFSPENKNEEVFKRYADGKGAEFGYPFFIILDAEGQVLTVQESGNLEVGDSYDEEKVLALFQQWVPAS